MRAPAFAKLLIPVPLVMLTLLACTSTPDRGDEAGSASAGDTRPRPSAQVRTGAAALGDDWRGDAPGVRRLIRSSDLPAPTMARSEERRVGRECRDPGVPARVKRIEK